MSTFRLHSPNPRVSKSEVRRTAWEAEAVSPISCRSHPHRENRQEHLTKRHRHHILPDHVSTVVSSESNIYEIKQFPTFLWYLSMMLCSRFMSIPFRMIDRKVLRNLVSRRSKYLTGTSVIAMWSSVKVALQPCPIPMDVLK